MEAQAAAGRERAAPVGVLHDTRVQPLGPATAKSIRLPCTATERTAPLSVSRRVPGESGWQT